MSCKDEPCPFEFILCLGLCNMFMIFFYCRYSLIISVKAYSDDMLEYLVARETLKFCAAYFHTFRHYPPIIHFCLILKSKYL